jgi:DNA-binding CsgD family transcriptional regulator
VIGREQELANLAGQLVGVRQGSSCAVVVRGEAGVGKTTLLEAVVASADGMRILRATGVESESELPFAGLHQLLAPLLDGALDTLMPPRRAALGAALGLAESAGAPDRFLVAAAVLDLLAAEAERTPVLALVDDVPWIDRASQDALLFVARRLDTDGIALIFGAREGDGAGFDARGLESVSLSGLDIDATVSLIRGRTGIAPAAGVAARLVAETRGNPLALCEIAEAIPVGVLRGTEPLPDPLPLSRGVEAVYGDRISRLPSTTRTMLLVAALEPSADTTVLSRAGAVLGAGLDDLEPAESARVIRIERHVTFEHPLVRSAVERGSTWAQRQRVHQALADGLPPMDADRRAWHAASAAVEPDERVAAELEDMAERSRRRGGNAAAQAALTRAAELTPAPEVAGRRLVAAADAAWHAGRSTDALALLDRASDVVSPDEACRAAHLRGVIAWRTGELAEAHRVLIEAARPAADIDPDRAVRMLGEVARAGAVGGNPAWIAEAAGVLHGIPEPPTEPARLIRTMIGALGELIGGDPGQGAAQLREVLTQAEQVDDVEVSSYAIMAAGLIGDEAIAMRLLARNEAAARERGLIAELPQLLLLRVVSENNAGRFGSAMAAADEGARLASDGGQRAPFAACRAHMACSAAVRGEMGLAIEAATEAGSIARELGMSIVASIAAYAISLVHIGSGSEEAALTTLGTIDHPILQPYRVADECEALVRLGRAQEAALTAERMLQLAAATRLPVNQARLERCRGLLAPDGGDPHFELAVELHADGQPFERARTELCFGESLRRARRRTDARAPLRRAFEAFERMGAQPWAERAERELRATGSTARRRDPSTVDQLTPQELAICRLVAGGLSNREAGGRLFLSARTIEYHLRKAFPKLGITSRVELARLDLGAGAVLEPVPAA